MRDRFLRLLRDSLQIYAAQVLGVLVSFGLSILVARTLGPEGRGAYGWIMALHFLAAQCVQFGGDTLNRRVGASQKDVVHVLAGNSIVQSLGVGFLVVSGFYAFGWLQPVGQLYPRALFLGLLAVPLVVLSSMWTSLATGAGRTGVLAVAEIVQKLSQAALVALFLVTVPLKVGHLTLAFVMSITLTVAYMGWRIHGIIHGQWQVCARLWWRERYVMLMAFIAGLCWQGLQRADLLMLGAWRSLEEVGHYAVAQSLMDASLILPMVIGFVLTARAAEEQGRGNRLKLMGMSMVGVGLVFGLMCLVAALLAPWFIPLLYGAAFAEVVPVFRGLMIAAVIVALYQVVQGALFGFARVRYFFIAPFVGLSVKVIFAARMIPDQGMTGAVLSSQLGYAAAFLTAVAIVLQKQPKGM